MQSNFGESALEFRLIFWINDVFYVERIRSKLRFAIDQKFRENNVTRFHFHKGIFILKRISVRSDYK